MVHVICFKIAGNLKVDLSDVLVQNGANFQFNSPFKS